MQPAGILVAAAAVAGVGLAGLWQWYQGASAQAEAAVQLRREHGERAERRWRGALESRLRRLPAGRALEARLAAAGIDVGAADALGLVAAGAGAAFVATSMVLPTAVGVAAAVGAVAAFEGYVRWRLARRTEEFIAQLPEVARTLSNGAAAGLALPSALAMAVSDVDEPARSALARVLEQLRLGTSVSSALEDLQRRMPSREVGVLVSTLVIQQRTGGDLVQALRDMARTLEARKESAREVRTTLAESKHSGYLVIALAVGAVLLLNLVEPGAVDQLVGTWAGRGVLLVSGSLFAAGALLIHRITSVEV